MWIGGTDIPVESHWMWATSNIPFSVSQTYWVLGQPDNYNGSEHCLGMVARRGYAWMDFKCERYTPFLCEREKWYKS